MKNFFFICFRIIAGGIGIFFLLGAIVFVTDGKIVPLVVCLTISLPTLAYAFWPRTSQKDSLPSGYSYDNECLAAKSQSVVRITYQDKAGRESTRDLEIYRAQDDNYVYAYCRLRKGPRTFLTSGIIKWEMLDEQFTFNPLIEEWFGTEGKKGSDQREDWEAWLALKQRSGIGNPYVLKKSPGIEETEFKENDDDSDPDAWEGGFWDATDPKKLAAYLQIDYKDGNGNLTTRSVRVKEFDNQLYDGLILGHCELRQAIRTFRFNRIQKCTNIETQTLVPNVRRYLNELYEKSPERSAELLNSDYADVLKVLYFVAKADGQYRKEEKEVIASYVRRLVRDDRITPTIIDEVLRTFEVPSLPSYKRAVGLIFKSGQIDPTLLRTCCHEIIETQKTVHPIEQVAIDYLDKKLVSHKKKLARILMN